MKRNFSYQLFFFLLFLVNNFTSEASGNKYPYPNDLRFEGSSLSITSGNTWCIYQDSQGFLWFGTDGEGLIKYDGMNCTVYHQVKGQIRDICEQKSPEGTILWIAALGNGLWKYNLESETFSHYWNDPSDSTSLSSDRTKKLTVHDGSLWISTWGGGLNILRSDQMQADKPEFLHLKNNPADPDGINTDAINEIYKDKRDTLWLGTIHGISKLISGYKPGEPFKFKNYLLYQDQNTQSLSLPNVCTIIEDRDHYLWIGTFKQGILKSTKSLPMEKPLRFRNYFPNPINKPDLRGFGCLDMLEDRRGNIWIPAIRGNLVKLYNRETDTFVSYIQDNNNPDSYPLAASYCIFEDLSGNLWFGGFPEVAKLSPYQQNFKSFVHQAGNDQSLLNKRVMSVSEDGSGNLWIATGAVLTRFNPVKKIFKHFQPDPTWSVVKLSNSTLRTIVADTFDKNYLWLGNLGEVLHKLDIKNGKFTHYSTGTVWDIFPSRFGFIWIAGQAGVIKFNPQSEQFDYITDKEFTGQSVYEDTLGHLWAGTYSDGLLKYDYLKDNQIWYKHDPGNNATISSNRIVSIYEDKNGSMWFGTAGGGLNKFDAEREIFTTFSVDDGLANNYVCGILEDDHGFLWISTNNGLSKFNPLDGSFKNFHKSDGIVGTGFIDRSCYKSPSSGYLFFGSTNGCTYFHPDSIKENLYSPDVRITDFKVFNKSVSPGKNSPLKKSVSFSKEIILSYTQSVFSFEFAALEYTSPAKNQYAYMMDGVDPDWVFVDASKRYATYTNLDPGDYLFRVKASNNDGIWNEEGTNINVIILPPWWKTNLAYIIYILVLIAGIAGTWHYQLKRIRVNHQLEVDHLKVEKLQEIDQVKSRFFANISHEFRTPLTLILGPIQSVLSKIRDVGLNKELNIVLRNATRLEHLVNQLLDLSRLEAGKMNLEVQNLDVIPLLRKLVLAFTSWAERKKISLKYKSTSQSLSAYVDKDKIEKIMNNLLSNAFKFTPEGGKIGVTVTMKQPPLFPFSKGETNPSPLSRGDTGGCNKTNSEFPVPNSDFVEITISNTGPGIPADKIDKIFDRFYQVDDSYTRDHEGTGIGLSLVKELVELHHGTIDVRCRRAGLRSRTTFTILLPLDREQFSDDEIIETPSSLEETTSETIPEEIPQTVESEDEPEEKQWQISQQEKPLILLIEDNPDMRDYIRDNLQDCYRVIEAVNGRQGKDLAFNKIPDLVLSDIMMPEMDGFQVCEAIKSDMRTSHIPVILLTARAEIKDKLKGLERGADDYISKPFVIEEIKVRVKNLIEQRQKLRERFSREALFGIKDIALTQNDEKFLHHAMEMINEHIDDPQFTVQNLGDSIGMSRMTLHLKLKALTDQSPHNFIRLLRLKKAAVLLKQKTANVTEVAYEVGFKNLSHFAKAFQEQFGETPSQFSARH